MEEAFRVSIEVLGVAPVAYVPDADQKQIIEELRNNMPDYLEPVVRKRETLIEDAWQSGCPIFSYLAGRRNAADWRGGCCVPFLCSALFIELFLRDIGLHDHHVVVEIEGEGLAQL